MSLAGWVALILVILIEWQWGLNNFYQVFPIMTGTLAYLVFLYIFSPILWGVAWLIERSDKRKVEK